MHFLDPRKDPDFGKADVFCQLMVTASLPEKLNVLIGEDQQEIRTVKRSCT
jgi:hypothetical protein